MPKTTPIFDPESYTPVAVRVRQFYDRFPAGRIVTELVSSEVRDGTTIVTFRALVFRSGNDTLPAATGWAAERDDDGEINAVACLENAETSAIGRALANLGFATSVRPSREEMEKAERGRRHLRAKEVGVPTRDASATRRDPLHRDDLRGRANRDSVIEVLSLSDQLERTMLDPTRVRRLRARIEQTRPTIASLSRVERLLRHRLAHLDDA